MPKILTDKKMTLITLHLPKPLLDKIDELVKSHVFPSRSEAIRFAIIKMLQDRLDHIIKEKPITAIA